jgi:LmbE family N-acetylglucosaminyl deacetylase
MVDGTAAGRQPDVIVFSPHPDDEVIACGGTIIRHVAAGRRVTVVFSTDGSMSHSAVLGIHDNPTPAELTAVRQKEAEAASRVMGLGPDDVHFLGFRDTRLADSVPEFRAAVTALLSRYRDVADVYLPHEVRELNADHRLTGEGVLDCLRDLGLSPRLHKFVVWDERTEQEFAFVNRRPADHGVDAGERLESVDISAQVPGKLAALREHHTQVDLYTPAQTRPVVPEAFVERVCTRPVEEFWTTAALAKEDQ